MNKIRRFVPGTESDKNVLYGVAIVRGVQGPDEYVHAFPEYVTEKEILLMQSPAAPSGLVIPTPTQTPTPTPVVTPLTPPISVPSLPQRPLRAFGLGIGPMGSLAGPGQGALGGMGSSPRTGPMGPMPTGSFNMGGVQDVPPVTVRTEPVLTSAISGLSSSVLIPVSAPVPLPASTPVAVTAATIETIKKVAQFCASNGATTINMLKNKAGAATVMPFLFEGQPGYDEFLSILKSVLGMASSTSVVNNVNTNTNNSNSNTNNSMAIPPPPVPPKR